MTRENLLIEKLRFQVEMLQGMVKKLHSQLNEVLYPVIKRKSPKLPDIVFERL